MTQAQIKTEIARINVNYKILNVISERNLKDMIKTNISSLIGLSENFRTENRILILNLLFTTSTPYIIYMHNNYNNSELNCKFYLNIY